EHVVRSTPRRAATTTAPTAITAASHRLCIGDSVPGGFVTSLVRARDLPRATMPAMSEALVRARRVVAVGAAALVVVLAALAGAAWRLMETEATDAASRGRSAAALAVEDLVRALAAGVDARAAQAVI